jgi:hypothetical protein
MVGACPEITIAGGSCWRRTAVEEFSMRLAIGFRAVLSGVWGRGGWGMGISFGGLSTAPTVR